MAAAGMCSCCKWTVWWAVSVSVFLLAKGLPQNCTVRYRPNLLCTVTKESRCPRAEQVKEFWPPAPSEFTVGTFMDELKQKNKTYLVPGLKFTWKPPPNVGSLSVKGFELQLKNMGGKKVNKERCFTFKLHGNITDLQTVFEYSVFPLEYKVPIMARLYSIPKPNPEYDDGNYKMQQVETPNFISKDHPVSSKWTFGLNFANDSCLREVACSFTIPPDILNIEEVDVGLLKKGEPNFFSTRRVRFPEHHAVFEGVPPGEYQIRLTVVDEFPDDRQRCRCRDDAGQCEKASCVVTVSTFFTMGKNLSECTSTVPAVDLTDPVDLTTSIGSPTSVASPSVGGTIGTDSDNQTVKYLGIIVGLVVACVLIVLLIFILRRKGVRCCESRALYLGGDNKPTLPPVSVNNNNSLKSPEAFHSYLRERVVYLVYTDDNAYHQRAVKMLARYLSAQCKCVVRYPAWCLQEIQAHGTVGWVLQSIQEADYVLIINSEGAFHLNKARMENSTPCQFNDSPIGDIFTPAIRNIIDNFYKEPVYKKYIMMQFSYSEDKFQIREISPGYKYTLIKHFRELLCHIHEINPEKPGAVAQCLPLHPDDHERTVEGRDLLQAIAAGTAFTKSYPNWYEEMYGTDEDRCDSGLSSLPVDSFPDHMREKIQQSCAENQRRTDLMQGKDMLLSGGLGGFIPSHRNNDTISITQSQVTFDPPVDLKSLFTDLGQEGGHPTAGGTGGYMSELMDHMYLMSQPSCGHTDSGRGSQRSTASQQSHPGMYSIQSTVPYLDDLIPPADLDSVSMNSQYNAMLWAQGFPADCQGPVVRASELDDASLDAMSV